MSGTVMQIIPKRSFSFTSVASGSGQAQEIVVAQGIDISQWREVALMVRTHSNGMTQPVGNITVYGLLEGRTSEDPGILFTDPTALGTVTITNATVAPAYTVSNLGSNLGAMLKIAVKGTRTNSNAANNILADISIDLSVKSA